MFLFLKMALMPGPHGGCARSDVAFKAGRNTALPRSAAERIARERQEADFEGQVLTGGQLMSILELAPGLLPACGVCGNLAGAALMAVFHVLWEKREERERNLETSPNRRDLDKMLREAGLTGRRRECCRALALDVEWFERLSWVYRLPRQVPSH